MYSRCSQDDVSIGANGLHPAPSLLPKLVHRHQVGTRTGVASEFGDARRHGFSPGLRSGEAQGIRKFRLGDINRRLHGAILAISRYLSGRCQNMPPPIDVGAVTMGDVSLTAACPSRPGLHPLGQRVVAQDCHCVRVIDRLHLPALRQSGDFDQLRQGSPSGYRHFAQRLVDILCHSQGGGCANAAFPPAAVPAVRRLTVLYRRVTIHLLRFGLSKSRNLTVWLLRPSPRSCARAAPKMSEV